MSGPRRPLLLALALALLAASPSAADPVAFRHGTVDNRWTTTAPGAPTGFTYVGRYHAADDPAADPPYMRSMTSYAGPGLRYDTSVPERCTAGDLQLALQGPAACPAGSRLGSGKADGKFMGSASTLDLDLFNDTDEVVMVARTPFLATISRGRIQPDNSVEWSTPTCYPSITLAGCPVDSALQVGSNVHVPPYVRGGRSYMTTPPSCPPSGEWQQPIRFWWADGTSDLVTSRHPCTP